MIEEIKEKIRKNPLCELSIRELDEIKKLDKSRDRSDFYELLKIFGKKYVAHTPEEITVDTIVYVGRLTINKALPTYNLKYIFGSLDYCATKIYNLENLCFVSRMFKILRFSEIDPLEFETISNLVNDKDYMLYKAKHSISELQYMSDDLKNDREYVLELVKCSGDSFRFASEELKKDKNFIL